MADTALQTPSAPGWHGPPPAKDPRRWYTLAAVNFALFMVLLDVTIVNVAIPSIARDFDTSFSNLQWVIATYTLTFAAFILTAAKIGDLFGRKRLFLVGLVLFSASSLACALSQNVTQLQIARGFQGVGAAFLAPIAAAIISATFWGPELGTAFGIYGGVSGVALAVGPIAGGALVRYVSWQSVFLVNVPIGIIGVIVGAFVIKESRSVGERPSIDVGGALLSIATLFLLTLGLIKGEDWGWTSGRTLGCFAASAVGLILFLGNEAWRMRTGRDPMMDLSLFRVRTFDAVAYATLTISLIYAGLLLVLTLLFQNVLGYDALGTGLRYIPFVIGSIVIAPAVGALANKVDPRLLFGVGLTVFGGGLLLLTRVTATSSWTVLLPGLLVAGVGGAALQAQLTNVAVSSAPRERAGQATGISATMRQVGASVGIALLGSIFSTRFSHHLPDELARAKVPAAVAAQVAHGASGSTAVAARLPAQVPSQFAAPIQHATHAAFVAGFNDMIRVAAVLVAVALVVSLAFIRPRDLHAVRGGVEQRRAESGPREASEREPAPATD